MHSHGTESSNWKRVLLACLPLLAAACGPGGVASGGTLTWTDDATVYRGMNGQRYSFVCPPNGTAGTVWGTDVYTDDSSICTAAVHAGKIGFSSGGTVTLEIRPGQATYVGSSHNGVTSQNYGQWDGSFIFP